MAGAASDRPPLAVQPSFARRLVAEGLGTALLLATVVGSGIMGERLAGGNVAIALLANALATGAGLAVFILVFGPISGAHFNPAVTLADASMGGLRWREVPGYLVAQVAGAFCGVAVAPKAILRHSLRGRSLHHRGLLVHCFHQLCESGGDLGAGGHRHLCRHPPGRRACVHRRADPRCCRGDAALPVACAFAP